MKKYTQGFTLIELLVVIAIIGILSSVVLVSLNTARQKGKDGRIQAEVSQLRAQLEATYDGTRYMEIIPSATADVSAIYTMGSANWNALVDDILKQQGLSLGITDSLANRTAKLAIASNAGSTASSTAYSIYALLNAGGYFCISSGGSTKIGTGTTLPTPTNASAGTCL